MSRVCEPLDPAEAHVLQPWVAHGTATADCFVWAKNILDFLHLVVGIHFSNSEDTLESMEMSFGSFKGSPILIARDNNFKAVCYAMAKDPTERGEHNLCEISLTNGGA